MAKNYKLAIVAGGLVGCAVAVRAELKGLANDNKRQFSLKNVSYLSVPPQESQWPAGLKLYTAVLMNVERGETLVKVTYPLAG
ncbi:MAG: hypothetical protein WDO70_11085 [Alphaproteobacteria bacterium]